MKTRSMRNKRGREKKVEPPHDAKLKNSHHHDQDDNEKPPERKKMKRSSRSTSRSSTSSSNTTSATLGTTDSIGIFDLSDELIELLFAFVGRSSSQPSTGPRYNRKPPLPPPYSGLTLVCKRFQTIHKDRIFVQDLKDNILRKQIIMKKSKSLLTQSMSLMERMRERLSFKNDAIRQLRQERVTIRQQLTAKDVTIARQKGLITKLKEKQDRIRCMVDDACTSISNKVKARRQARIEQTRVGQDQRPQAK